MRFENLSGTATAWLILIGGFYALVLYPLALDPLINGALISLMTLAANYVFASRLGESQARRQQAAFDSGVNTSPLQPEPPSKVTTTVETPPPGDQV